VRVLEGGDDAEGRAFRVVGGGLGDEAFQAALDRLDFGRPYSPRTKLRRTRIFAALQSTSR
jgi:hypothetical protein